MSCSCPCQSLRNPDLIITLYLMPVNTIPCSSSSSSSSKYSLVFPVGGKKETGHCSNPFQEVPEVWISCEAASWPSVRCGLDVSWTVERKMFHRLVGIITMWTGGRVPVPDTVHISCYQLRLTRTYFRHCDTPLPGPVTFLVLVVVVVVVVVMSHGGWFVCIVQIELKQAEDEKNAAKQRAMKLLEEAKKLAGLKETDTKLPPTLQHVRCCVVLYQASHWSCNVLKFLNVEFLLTRSQKVLKLDRQVLKKSKFG